jgi:hypothetical protein
MASIPQSYPRTENGLLDITRLPQHTSKLAHDELTAVIRSAIERASQKSSRVILKIPDNATPEEHTQLYKKKGKELFKYFIRYYGDPATTAYDCYGRHYSLIAREQFRNQSLQKERMNSGWRYQFIAKDCAVRSRRFTTVSDIGAAEADFNATIPILDSGSELNIYVSIKNRINTMGGQDWPKAIAALEGVARTDKNRSGPYLCVFGIVMEKGQRTIKGSAKTKEYHSVNTEVWLSDFFWPFFANYSYPEIAKAVLQILMEKDQKPPEMVIPDELVEAFGAECSRLHLLDQDGAFNDPVRLIDVFCNNINEEEGGRSNSNRG